MTVCTALPIAVAVVFSLTVPGNSSPRDSEGFTSRAGEPAFTGAWQAMPPDLAEPRTLAVPVPSLSPAAVRAVRGAAAFLSPRDVGGGPLAGVRVRVGRAAPRAFVTNAATVAQLLDTLGVRLGSDDIVIPPARATLTHGLEVRVVQVRYATETVMVVLPYEKLIQYSNELPVGESRTQRDGSPGEIERTYRVTYRNGVEVARTLLAETTVRSPVDAIVVRGSLQPTGASGSNYQYGEASWYTLGDCEGFQAAHKTLPFGTSVTVTNLDNGRSVTVVINDRGPYGPGRIIDLCPSAFSAIAPLSQGVARVRISW